MSSSDSSAHISELREAVRFAAQRLWEVSRDLDTDAWNGALAVYQQAVRTLTAVAAFAETDQATRKLAELERKNRVLEQRNRQLKQDLDYTEDIVAKLLVSIQDARAAAEEVREWTTVGDHASRFADHVISLLPDPDAEDPYQDEDEDERCYGIHSGSDGPVDCDGRPI